MFLVGSLFCVFGALLSHFMVEDIPLGEDLSRAEAIFERYQREDAEEQLLKDRMRHRLE